MRAQFFHVFFWFAIWVALYNKIYKKTPLPDACELTFEDA
jgi:hypothetical protein